MDKLTSKFQAAIADAQSIAVGRDHQFIESVHLMLALLDQNGGTARHLLTQTAVDIHALRSRLGQVLDGMAQIPDNQGDIQVSNDLARLLNMTDKLAQQRKDQFISSELFLLAALDDKGQLGTILRELGANKKVLSEVIDKVRGGQSVNDPNAEDQRQALEKYTVDLTELAEQGKLDPVIGKIKFKL